MKQGKLNIATCHKDLAAFKKILDGKNKNIGEERLLKFFKVRKNLLLLMGKMNIDSPRFYKEEFNIFNEFYADFAIADRKKEKYLFVEFEDAKRYSVFKGLKNSKTKKHDWSARFEHGFSQIVDWFYRLDDYSKTNKFAQHFGTAKIEYTAILVIGRAISMPPGSQSRLDWRMENVDIHKKKVICLTYDALYQELVDKLDIVIDDSKIK
ncbi:MAG: Shedu anti-phage system protein SduA domain-containing protein [Bacteroidia bacterium]